MEVGQGKALPDYDSQPICDALLKWEPVENVEHEASDVAKFGYATNEAGSRAQDLIQAPQTANSEASKYMHSLQNSGFWNLSIASFCAFSICF